MRGTRTLVGFGMGAALALLTAGPALADEFSQNEESFVLGAQLYQSGARYTGRELYSAPDPVGTEAAEEPFVAGVGIYKPGSRPQYAGREPYARTLYAHTGATTSDATHSGLELRRIWSDSEEALGVGH